MRFEDLPWAIRQAGVAVVGWRNRGRRYGREYRAWTRFLADSAGWNPQERERWQLRQLARLVREARAGTPYYAEALAGVGDPEGEVSLEGALQRLPLLDKQSIRNDARAFRNASVREVATTSTSGSTGAPMTVGHDAASIQRRFVFMADHPRFAGIDPFEPSVRLSGRIICRVGKRHPRPWLFNPAERQLFLSTYHLDEAHQARIASKLSALEPVLLDGYPSGILETLRLLAREGTRLTSLKAVITTAETLLPDMRAEIHALSGVPVMDYYAASEGVPFIQQCPHGTYHVRWQSGIFEVAAADRVTTSGDGELIVTSFVQDRTPLIRYRTGDLVRGLTPATGKACACGLDTPVVAEVLGRVEDMIYTPDGRALGMFTYRTLKLIPGLGETQVIQQDFDVFEVNSVTPGEDDSLPRAVQASFERALGYPITLRFNRVAALPKGANGKVRLVMSRVARAGAATP